MSSSGEVLRRMSAAVVLAAAMLAPAGPARAVAPADITGQVLAGHDVALQGDSIVDLVPAENSSRQVSAVEGGRKVSG